MGYARVHHYMGCLAIELNVHVHQLPTPCFQWLCLRVLLHLTPQCIQQTHDSHSGILRLLIVAVGFRTT